MYIASSLNEYYLPYTYTMLLSLFMSNREERFEIFLIADELSEDARGLLNSLALENNSKIHYLKPDIQLLKSALDGKTDWGLETSFRLTLCDLLPPYIDRVLYLDGDIVILNSITNLYNMDFEDSEIIAGHDLFSCDCHKSDALAIHSNAFEEIISEGSYFNAGVVLYNMDILRKNNISDQYFSAIDLLDCRLPYPDQDILNYVHHNKVKYFDTMSYNFQSMLAVSCNGGYTADRVRKEICIVHYIDKKPWSGGDHIHYDAENIWWDYALQTPFAKKLMEKYVRSSMDEYVHDSVSELRSKNEQLHKELQRVSEHVKNLLASLSNR